MKKPSIGDLRREYRTKGLLESKVPSAPLPLFKRWFKEALKVKALDANAVALATVGEGGRPASRMVLLKGVDSRGFVFFTNYESQKGRELLRNAQASLLFFWPQLARQVRADGKVEKISARESDTYFKTRPLGSQLGAWASDQSRVIQNREELERRMETLKEKYKDLSVPRPPHWGGFRVRPNRIEFWKGRPNRLHDRLRYRLLPTGRWKIERLAP